MAKPYEIKRHDTAPLHATLRDARKQPLPLTGAAVRFLMKATNGLKSVVGAAVVVDGAEGTVRYDPQPTDTDTAGLFRAEWEVTFGDGTVKTVPNDGWNDVVIREDLG